MKIDQCFFYKIGQKLSTWLFKRYVTENGSLYVKRPQKIFFDLSLQLSKDRTYWNNFSGNWNK